MISDHVRFETGVPNLDAVAHGGVPAGSLIAISGSPGSGKTILAQQICFHHATARDRVLYFGTLSEPTAKLLRYLRQFSFFDPEQFGTAIEFIDLGDLTKLDGLVGATEAIVKHVKRVQPSMIVIDSFKTFVDLARSRLELRTFGYRLAVELMTWEATTFLVGEYQGDELRTSPLLSMIDGLWLLSQRESAGEHQRFFQIIKMRGSDHSREPHVFQITGDGIELFAPREVIRREPIATERDRCQTKISRLDTVLGGGIPWGSAMLLSGAAGTGKTMMCLELVYRGAQAGERGILFSFEETPQRLHTAARGLGWDLQHEVTRGLVEIVYIPQPDIAVEANLHMIGERIARLNAKRVAIDSVSLFLHRITDPQVSREKVFHLCSMIQNARAIGMFATEVAYGSSQISKFGVEETVVDGVILLSSVTEGFDRQRYLEVYKLRDSAHLDGRHPLLIGADGITLFPRYELVPTAGLVPAARRVPSGISGLDPLLGDGLLARSVTLVSGSSGIGKSTFVTQFLLAGAARGEPGLLVTLDESAEQRIAAAQALGLPLQDAVDSGLVNVMYLSRDSLRGDQFLTVLSDKLTAMRGRRVAIDAITQLLHERFGVEELRHVLHKLAARFKALDITSMLAIDAPSLYSSELGAERSLSPIADNLLVLRYLDTEDGMMSRLTIIKTRGSEHSREPQCLTIRSGGIVVGPPLPAEETP
ncbi:MAG: ATPase domain-containing protein [Kofleriaceae bacterium]